MRPGAESPGLMLVGTVQCNNDRRGYVVFVIGIGGVIEPHGGDWKVRRSNDETPKSRGWRAALG